MSKLGQKLGLWISVSGSSQASWLGCSSNHGVNRCLCQSNINQLLVPGSCPQGDNAGAGHTGGGGSHKAPGGVDIYHVPWAVTWVGSGSLDQPGSWVNPGGLCSQQLC